MERRLRITGSTFKDYVDNPKKKAAALWSPRPDLSRVKSIRWGNENEEVARAKYEEETGCTVQKCGLFVNKKEPLFAASPDGLIPAGLLEIKCPFSLRFKDLNTLKKEDVPSSQFFTIENGKLKLKRSHGYFFQVQLAMYVTGLLRTDFVI